jgi:hypothetical protein
MFKRTMTLVLGAALCSVAPRGVAAADKPFEASHEIESLVCPPGATTLCIPLDASFTVVNFDGVGGSGPANPADPCQRNDDDVTLAIALPFSFDLYGTLHNQVYINNNGNISFGSSFSTFTSTGFPIADFPMVAPFWADVDTREMTTGVVYYKIEPTRLTVIWDHVGYYNTQADKLNTFQLIITDGTDPVVGVGNNVCFCYDDMQWTTGSASGGVGGFGGTPATVGVNKGDGVNFAQIGRFDHAGADYDGPGGNPDGVSYLDNQRFCFDTSTGGADNIPPVAQGFPAGNVFEVCAGECDTLETAFTSPELGQTTSTVVDLMGLANANATSVAGNPSTQRLIVCPTLAQVGDHLVRYTATDDGVPSLSTTVDLTVRVTDCRVPAEKPSWSRVKALFR